MSFVMSQQSDASLARSKWAPSGGWRRIYYETESIAIYCSIGGGGGGGDGDVGSE
jgi:hypothetical protein